MGRKKRGSAALETARKRLAGLKSIDPPANFGPGMTEQDYEGVITAFQNRLDTYNEHSAELDQEQTEVDAEEDKLNDWNKRYLAAGGARFGTDSKEYEALGGTRTSDRKKPKRGGSGGGDSGTGGTGTGTAGSGTPKP
jgi:hypothetical protein